MTKKLKFVLRGVEKGENADKKPLLLSYSAFFSPRVLKPFPNNEFQTLPN